MRPISDHNAPNHRDGPFGHLVFPIILPESTIELQSGPFGPKTLRTTIIIPKQASTTLSPKLLKV